jgi:hypothetical protein
MEMNIMGQSEKRKLYREAMDLGLNVKWNMSESEIEDVLKEHQDSLKPKKSSKIVKANNGTELEFDNGEKTEEKKVEKVLIPKKISTPKPAVKEIPKPAPAPIVKPVAKPIMNMFKKPVRKAIPIPKKIIPKKIPIPQTNKGYLNKFFPAKPSKIDLMRKKKK